MAHTFRDLEGEDAARFLSRRRRTRTYAPIIPFTPTEEEGPLGFLAVAFFSRLQKKIFRSGIFAWAPHYQ